MNSTLSKKKIAIAIFFLVLLAALAVYGLLYVAAAMLVKYVGSLADVSPSASLPYMLAKFGNQKEKGFGFLALVLGAGITGWSAMAPASMPAGS